MVECALLGNSQEAVQHAVIVVVHAQHHTVCADRDWKSSLESTGSCIRFVKQSDGAVSPAQVSVVQVVAIVQVSGNCPVWSNACRVRPNAARTIVGGSEGLE